MTATRDGDEFELEITWDHFRPSMMALDCCILEYQDLKVPHHSNFFKYLDALKLGAPPLVRPFGHVHMDT
jgi:hypothetical protein